MPNTEYNATYAYRTGASDLIVYLNNEIYHRSIMDINFNKLKKALIKKSPDKEILTLLETPFCPHGVYLLYIKGDSILLYHKANLINTVLELDKRRNRWYGTSKPLDDHEHVGTYKHPQDIYDDFPELLL